MGAFGYECMQQVNPQSETAAVTSLQRTIRKRRRQLRSRRSSQSIQFEKLEDRNLLAAVFHSDFEYAAEPAVGTDTANLNGAIDQVGTFSGTIPGVDPGDGRFDPEVIGFDNAPNGQGRLMIFDRPIASGQFNANLASDVNLKGTTVSMDLASSRTLGNSRDKDYDIVGFDSAGNESFHVTISTSNNNGGTHDETEERLGVVTNNGGSTFYDFTTVIGDDADGDMDNIGTNAVGATEISNIQLILEDDGFVINFARDDRAYVTDVLPYNGVATTLSRVEFQFAGSNNRQQNTGFVLDNLIVDHVPSTSRTAIFQTAFEYGAEPAVGTDAANLDGATGQIGTFSGVLPTASGGQFGADPIGFENSPVGGRLLWLDRPNADGGFSANMSAESPVNGAVVSFDVGTRRTQNNTTDKDYDVVGFDSSGNESFHLTISASNDGGGPDDGTEERLGVITDGGATTTYDLTTVVGADADSDLDNTGGPAFTNTDLANIRLELGETGYTIQFTRDDIHYVTEEIAYNGSATMLDRIDVQFSGAPANNSTAGFMMDNISVTIPPAIPSGTIFSTAFEYTAEPGVGRDMSNLNGATGQIGLFSGIIPVADPGGAQFDPEVIGFANSPVGGRIAQFDRAIADGSFDANFVGEVGTEGTTISMDIGTRRTQGNSRNKDYDIVGLDSHGVESFHLTVSASSNNGGTHDGAEERLGVLTQNGQVATYDFPTTAGADADDDLNNTGGGNPTAGEIANISVALGENGYVISFVRGARNYVTEEIEYNGPATSISRVQFQFNGSDSTQSSTGFFIDNVNAEFVPPPLIKGRDDAAAADEDGPAATFDLTANDIADPAGDVEITALDTTGTLGLVTLNGDNDSVSYDPNGAFEILNDGDTATDTFSYTITDGVAGSKTALVTVTITGTNDAPVAVDDTAATTEDAAVTVVAPAATSSLLENDSDVDSLIFTPIEIFSGTGANTSIIENTVNGTPTITFADPILTLSSTGNNNFNGGLSSTDDIDTLLGTPLLDTDTVFLELVVDSLAGNLVANGFEFGISPGVAFRPANNLLFHIEDGGAVSHMTSTSIVDGNAAAGWSATEGSILNGFTASLTADQDGYTFAFTGLDAGGADTSFSGTFANPTQFRDLFGGGHFYLTAQKSNNPDPMVTTISQATIAVNVDVTEDITVTAADAASARGAAVAVNPDGTFSYDPTAALVIQTLDSSDTVTDTFSYTISDGALTDSASVSIVVTGVNDAPVANDDIANTPENTPVLVSVLANDDDIDGDDSVANFTLDSIDGVTTNGTSSVTVAGNLAIDANAIQFTPGTTFDHLADGVLEELLVSYTMSDDEGATASAVAAITVVGVNDAPATVTDAAGTTEDASTTVDVLLNDSDADDGDSITIQSVDGTGTSGSVSTDGATVTYDPNGQFETLADGVTATDTFTYTAVDTEGATTVETVTITVTGVNDTPTADAGGPYVISEGDSLALDGSASSDIDAGTVLTYTWDINGDGNFGDATGESPTVTWAQLNALSPAIDNGPATFDVLVQVDDGFGAVTSSVVTLTVNNTPPIATITGPNETVPNQPTPFSFTATDPAPGDDAAGFTFVIDYGDGSPVETIGPAAAGVQAVTHAFPDFGDFTISLTTTDQDGDSDTVTFPISVVPVAKVGDDIFVGGTDAVGDRIIVQEAGRDEVFVRYNNQRFGSFEVSPTSVVIIYGGDGQDRISVTNCIATEIHGEEGNDQINGGSCNDIVYGGDGRDIILLGEGDNWADGGSGNDIITGRSGSDTIYGGGGNDLIQGGVGNDFLFGGLGNDRIVGGGSSDLIDGGSGNDILNGSSGADLVLGGLGNDIIRGDNGTDWLIGGEGADALLGKRDSDILVSGSADNEADEAAQRAALLDWATSGVATGMGSYAADTDVDSLSGGGNSDDLFASGDDNVFIRGSDTLTFL
jgi:VCBS repeat-containing protein